MPELFITQAVSDPETIKLIGKFLDQWSSSIPFSPIKKLGSQTQFVSAIAHVTYRTTVTTQIEKRWLEDHEEPYREQELPETHRPKSEFDPWETDFDCVSDFKPHRQSKVLFETRSVYDCTTCDAIGRVTCSGCAGKGKVDCSSCNGYGHITCGQCDGAGHLRKSRTIPRQVNCGHCSGSGTFVGQCCSSCGGKGTVIKDFYEDYYIPCGNCAASGKITCSTCRGRGEVTCSTCEGTGEVTCPTCEGTTQLISYTTVEQSEEPVVNDHQFIPQNFPQFKKKENPLSNLEGELIYSQEEEGAITVFEFQNDQAGEVLKSEVETCRAKHEGHILRQRVDLNSCPILEYHYRYQGKEYTVFINPKHKIAEGLAGPIQSAIENTDALAEKAFKEKRFEDAYRLVLRGLCMDEATESEKKLRDKILSKLTSNYIIKTLIVWGLLVLAWWFGGKVVPDIRFNWYILISAIPLLAGAWLFVRDWALGFTNSITKIISAMIISLCAFCSGAAIHAEPTWVDWIPFGMLTIFLIGIAAGRSNERAKRNKIEEHLKEFSDAKALENYVFKLDKNQGADFRTIMNLSIYAFFVILISVFAWLSQ